MISAAPGEMLPIPAAQDAPAVKDVSGKSNKASQENFSAILEEELGAEGPSAKAGSIEGKKPAKEEPWAIFGVNSVSTPAAAMWFPIIDGRGGEALAASDSPTDAISESAELGSLTAESSSATPAESAPPPPEGEQVVDLLKVVQPQVDKASESGRNPDLAGLEGKSPPDLQNLPDIQPSEPPDQAELAGPNPSTPENSRGMAGAKKPAMLLVEDNREKNAAAPQGDALMPDAVSDARPVISLYPELNSGRRVSAWAKPAKSEDSSVNLDFAISNTPNLPGKIGDGGSADFTIQAPVATRAAEQIQSNVHVLKLHGNERMEVMISPDAKTQLHLDLRVVEGQVLVQVRCEKGDAAALQQHWPALQQSLAQQGIRVESLQAGNNSAGQDDSMGRERRQQEQQSRDFDNLLVLNPDGGASAKSNLRWQHWA